MIVLVFYSTAYAIFLKSIFVHNILLPNEIFTYTYFGHSCVVSLLHGRWWTSDRATEEGIYELVSSFHALI